MHLTRQQLDDISHAAALLRCAAFQSPENKRLRDEIVPRLDHLHLAAYLDNTAHSTTDARLPEPIPTPGSD